MQIDESFCSIHRGKSITEIKNNRRDERNLIMLRNKLAYYLTTKVKYEIDDENDKKRTTFQTPLLPEPILHASACLRCLYNTVCCAYLSRDDNQQLSSTHPLQRIMHDKLKQFSREQIDYFVYWTGLVRLEALRPSRKDNPVSNMWTKSAEWRQKQNHAICELKINGPVVYDNGKYLHEFVVNHTADATEEDLLKFELSGMQIGDFLRLSTRKRVAVANGRLKTIKKDSIAMTLDRLVYKLWLTYVQFFFFITCFLICSYRNLTKQFEHETFILDRSASTSLSRFYLSTLGLFMDDRQSSAKLRRYTIGFRNFPFLTTFISSIIIDRMKPTFSDDDDRMMIFDNEQSKHIMAGLNISQQNAVIKAVTANDYLVVKGLPGTGKTETLVAIAMLYSLMGKSVLIVSHSHCAVDNVLLKLLDKGLEFIRLKSEMPLIVPEVQKYTEEVLTENCETTEDLRKVYNKYVSKNTKFSDRSWQRTQKTIQCKF